MKTEYIEGYETLMDLSPGRLAVSRDRKHIFLCLFVPKPAGAKDSFATIVDLNNPNDQYVYNIDMHQAVRILPYGDRIIITA